MMSHIAVIILALIGLVAIVGSIISTRLYRSRLVARTAPSPDAVLPTVWGRSRCGAFVQPGDLMVDRWDTLEFIVGPDATALADEAGGQLQLQARNIFVSATMQVSLKEDPNFEILAKTAAIQNTGLDGTASWQWNVKPLTDGTHILYARVEVLKPISDGDYVTLDEYANRVLVRVIAIS